MNFLQSYTIPTIARTDLTPSQSGQQWDLPKIEPNTENYSQVAPLEPPPQFTLTLPNSSRFFAPGKSFSKFRDSAPRAGGFKRKYPGAKPEPPAEFTPDGKLAIFFGRDESYPDELNKLIRPAQCDLCSAQMNSSQSAKDHYESKAHDRHITSWIVKYALDKGISTPLTVKRFLKDGGVVGPEAYHCDVCDLNLTSQAHASQHYSGRKHQMVVQKSARPSGSGYYNNDGKWVRVSTKVEEDKSGRFGIGVQFIQPAVNAVAAADTTTEGDTDEKPPVKVPKLTPAAIPMDPSLHCTICNISVTSATQMITHIEGIKHRKKMVSSGVVEQAPQKSSETAEVADAVTVTDITPVDNSNVDLAMYRTPSGLFYCKICNTSMQHSAALVQHLSGKKHVRKVAEEKATLALQNKQTN